MNLTAFALEKKTVTYFAICLIALAGISSFFSLGQLEDPEFTVKTAVITTTYPGATPSEVELEVTDRIELAIQELHEIDYLESFSKAGLILRRSTGLTDSPRYGTPCAVRYAMLKQLCRQVPAGRRLPMILATSTVSNWC